MAKRKKATKKAPEAIDGGLRKRGPGRPGVSKSETQGRAYDYRLTLEQHWNDVAEAFLMSQSEEDFNRAFGKAPEYLRRKFVRNLFPTIVKIRKDLKFPKTPKKQMDFFADSLAGLGIISPRRSRDICAEGRKQEVHSIIRQDFYIECTCGYEGPAKFGACPKCGTKTIAWSERFRGAGIEVAESDELASKT
ncbi:hypothetical protein MYX77_09125 [Acidobacteriia bacterium AH_259_A11_L15]|nr:hypothetical protein [Acidobacteriia bacterium AH_259_A11_L15]